LIAAKVDSVSEIALASERNTEATLHLSRSQVASGTVRATAEVSLPADTTVECVWEAGGQREPLFVAKVQSGGAWGPCELPSKREGTLIFRLSGGDLIPVEEIRHTDPALRDFVVDFQALMGTSQWARVTNQKGVPVEGVRVEVEWASEKGRLRSVAWSNEEGRAELCGCPQTECDLRATKPGLVEFSWPGIYIVTPGDIEVSLVPAGRVIGTVVHAGMPVEDFRIYSWTEGPKSAQSHRVPRNAEGRFELDTISLDRVTLLASSPGYSESEPVTVDLSYGQTQAVVMELAPGVSGYGHVVDAYSGVPLVGATVQPLTEFSGEVLGPQGSIQFVDAAGEFEVQGIAAGSARVAVECPGRVSVRSEGQVDSSGRVNFGVIPLAERQDLDIQLRGTAPFDTSDVWFMADGEYPISYLPIGSSGHLVVPDVAPGIYSFLLVWDDGTTLKKRQDLRPGEQWSVEFEFSKGNSFQVQLIADEGGSLPEDLKISAAFSSPREEWVSRAVAVDESGVARFDHIGSDSVFVQVASGSWLNLLATKQVTLDHSGTQLVEIELSGRSLEIHAVDPKGKPLDEGFITVNPTDPSIRWVSFQHISSTDPLTVGGISLDEVVVSVRHSVLGLGLKTVAMQDEGLTEVTIEVGNGLPLELRVRDVEGPVPAVRCMLIPKGITTRGYQGDTDVNGALRYDNFPPGRYIADLDRYGYWPVDHELEFRGEASIELPIRRRGNFEATIYGLGGAQVTGVPVELLSLEFDTPVSAWLEAGKLSSETARLTSDVQGRVFAKGIPRGAYRWSLAKPDGTTLSGEVQVPPGGTASEAISLEGE
jgi:hypothetical protein